MKPWSPFWVESSIDGELQVGALIPKDVFDALLAVAKAAEHDFVDSWDLCPALDALDAAYPDWREWTS